MTEIECIAKKWGGSIGIVLPKDIVEKEHISPDEHIRISIQKIPRARDIWSLGPITTKDSTQKIKDELRKGW
jgi:hypothetical protein